MKTEILKLDANSCKKAGEIINSGGIVAFPTETVYGLGASVYDKKAIASVFFAKGRPSDNPLIVHVAEKEQIGQVAREINTNARLLIDKFMPGPITVVLPKRENVPNEVTAGIDTVGVRIPQHKGAREFLKSCGCPVAAPSANSSGKPSPTSAKHVFDDLEGKIPLILDGGECTGGVESTVISLCGEVPLLLRPGLVTYEMLTEVLGRVDIHPAVLENGKVDKAASPGMKYKHYSPKARVIIVDGKISDADRLYDMCKGLNRNPLIVWNMEDTVNDGRNCAYLMHNSDTADAAKNLFSVLRSADRDGYDTVLISAVKKEGAGLSVMNRMLRAAAFTVINGGDISCLDEQKLKTVLQIT